MSHEFEQGFFVHKPAWHGLGVVLPEYPGREAAMKLAGHDFEVVERPVYIGSEMLGAPVIAPGFKGLVRSDNDHVLSVQRDSYAVIQPSALWDIADAIVNVPNVRYKTAGTLRGGAVQWVLAWLDEPIDVPGTQIYPFVCVSTTHDGTGACRADNTAVTVVCMNTIQLAWSQANAAQRSFVFRHTANVSARIEEAREVVTGTRRRFAEFAELTRELVDMKITSNGIEAFLKTFIPLPAADVVSERVRANVEKARQDVLHVLNNGNGTIVPEARNTAWGLLSAGTEYLDHIRAARSPETKMGRSILRGEPLKAKLVPLVREIGREFAAV